MLALVLDTALPGLARAQSLDIYLPTEVKGEAVEQGVTVLTRVRTGYEPEGLHFGNWTLTPVLTESAGYNSNVAGFANGEGSSFVDTHGTAHLTSGGSIGRITADAYLDDIHYLDVPKQSYTNWTAQLATTHKLGGGEATLAYTHLNLNQITSDFGALPADGPVSYRVDDLRGFYISVYQRFAFTPQFYVQHYTTNDTTVLGVPVSLRYQERTLFSAGLELRYSLTDQRSLVFVGQGLNIDYRHDRFDFPSQASKTELGLVGFDAVSRGLWRLRLLAGAEARQFTAWQYKPRWSPILQSSLLWTPQGDTTVRFDVTRSIEDPADSGTQGFTISKATLLVDREVERDLLVGGSLGFVFADPLQVGASQKNVLFGASITRLIDRHTRLVLKYDYDLQRGPNINLTAGPGYPSELRIGNFDRHVVSLGLRLAM